MNISFYQEWTNKTFFEIVFLSITWGKLFHTSFSISITVLNFSLQIDFGYSGEIK